MRISDWSSDVCSSDLQHLADALEFYFSQSEQLPTLLRLAYDGTHVRGLMLQRLPLGENNSSEDNWQHVSVLFKTLQEAELAATPGLTMLRRLFHEDTLRVFEDRKSTRLNSSH